MFNFRKRGKKQPKTEQQKRMNFWDQVNDIADLIMGFFR